MRKFFLGFAILVAFFALTAQDSTNDLYQQYLNQYKKEKPAPAAQPAEEKKEEPAPAAQPVEEKKEEPAQPAQPAEEKKEEKKEEPAPAAEPEKKEEAPAEGEAAAKEEAPAENPEAAVAAAEAEDSENKLDFERNPYFSIDTFGAMSIGLDVYGGDVVKEESHRFGLDNAVIDLKGGDKMFNGRILFDLAKVADEGNRMYNVLKDVSFRMEHPSYRSGNNGFGMNVNLQAGLFGLPFGIEGGYDHEITFANSAVKEEFLGGAFRDLGISLGLDFIFNPKSDLALTLFVFNGKNETMLDGDDLLSAPAFGADLRFNYASDFYATAVLSFVVGGASHRFEGGFAENGLYYEDEDGETYYNVEDVNGNKITLNRSTNNFVLALGLDLGYNINDNVSVGLKGEFAYSRRDLYNPEIDDPNKGNRLLFDGVWAAGSSYNPFGFFVMPYATLWDFDTMLRFSYYRDPFYQNYVADGDNSHLEFDFALIYNFCDYAGVEFDYIFKHWTEHAYDDLDNNEKYTNFYNEHAFYLALTGWFDFLWEKSGEAKAE